MKSTFMARDVKTRPAPISNSPSQDPETSSHIPVHSVYTPANLEGHNLETEIGYPGQYPFTRGVQATMYRGRLWTMRQYAGMGDAEESNKRYKYLLAHGTTGLSVAFDLPTQIGMDSDHPLAAGEVGKVGVAIDSIEDMQRLFDGIELTKISISGYHMREAGSTAVQELAFTLGNGMTYVEAAIKAGLDVDKFAPRLSFFFNSHNNFLEEVAKFRAARRMWARIMREHFKAKNPRSWMLRFHTQTAGSTLTAQQPQNNIVRTAIQAMAAVLGGTQSLHTNS